MTNKHQRIFEEDTPYAKRVCKVSNIPISPEELYYVNDPDLRKRTIIIPHHSKFIKCNDSKKQGVFVTDRIIVLLTDIQLKKKKVKKRY